MILRSTSGTNRWLAYAALLLMSALWGSTFFSIKDLVTRVPAVDMLATRFAITTLVLVVIGFRSLHWNARVWFHGAVLGLFFGVAQIAQTIGLGMTQASTSGFITGLYLVLTPLISAVVLHTSVARRIWMAVILGTVGMAILGMQPSAHTTTFGWGEVLTLIGALLFASHIVYAGRVSKPELAVTLTVSQSVVVAALCYVFAAPGGIVVPNNWLDWALVGYLAVFAGALTLFLQIWAQARVEPTRAAIIMAMEPAWAAAFAVAVGQEAFTLRMFVGGMSVISALVVISLPIRRV